MGKWDSSAPGYSWVEIVTMDRIKADCTSPVQPGDAERSKTGEQDPELTVLRKAEEFFQICDLEGKGFVTCQDMQVKQNWLCGIHNEKDPKALNAFRLTNLELKML